jgi:uncharacterized hydrophobic protein (TIGR00271 family)
MAAITADDVVRMRDQLFFDGPLTKRKLTRFWMLLLLAGVIATAGVISDSTATVIGAMIVAPLMTPILGIVLGIVLADRNNLLRSIGLVISGAAAVILLAWLMGHLAAVPVTAVTSSQVAGRIHPRTVDLVAALATGAVGAIALARSDISDTLPGVAIAISLVPPLAVVGLTLEAGATDEALGALLLFGTNVAAILLSGVIVMAVYKVSRRDEHHGQHHHKQGLAVAVIVVAVLVLAVPLSITTRTLTVQSLRSQQITDAATAWVEGTGWRLDSVESTQDGYVVVVAGKGDPPDATELRSRLSDAGLSGVKVTLDLQPEERIELQP